jgi:hypothetical protein
MHIGLDRILTDEVAMVSLSFLGECQIRFSPVYVVMHKLPAHPPIFIPTPSQRLTLICIHTLDLITLLYYMII